MQDAQAAAELGFSSIKIDGCGPSSNISAWAAAFNATGKKILLEDCLTKQFTWNKLRQFNWTEHSVHLAEVFETCPGHFFRLGDDIGPQFVSTAALFADFRKSLTNKLLAPDEHNVQPHLDLPEGAAVLEARRATVSARLLGLP